MSKGNKTRRYKGDKLCEASIGVNYDRGAPQIMLCKKPATWLYFYPEKEGYPVRSNFGFLVCDECLERVKTSGDDGGERIVGPRKL